MRHTVQAAWAGEIGARQLANIATGVTAISKTFLPQIRNFLKNFSQKLSIYAAVAAAAEALRAAGLGTAARRPPPRRRRPHKSKFSEILNFRL